MLGNALNVLGNHVRVKYEKNVLRIRRSLLTQVTLLAENLLPEGAALLSGSMCCSGLFILAPSHLWDFPASSKEKGQSVVMRELNLLAAKVRSLNQCCAFKLITSP